MATRHGKNAVLYWGAVTAIPVAETHDDITASMGPDFAPDTAHGDSFETSIPGILKFDMSFSSWFDTAYHTLIDAAIGSTTAKFYWYPDRADNTIYWWGTAYVAMDSYSTPMGGIVDTAFKLVAATQPTYKHP